VKNNTYGCEHPECNSLNIFGTEEVSNETHITNAVFSESCGPRDTLAHGICMFFKGNNSAMVPEFPNLLFR
jgi:hypothetical protein